MLMLLLAYLVLLLFCAHKTEARVAATSMYPAYNKHTYGCGYKQLLVFVLSTYNARTTVYHLLLPICCDVASKQSIYPHVHQAVCSSRIILRTAGGV